MAEMKGPTRKQMGATFGVAVVLLLLIFLSSAFEDDDKRFGCRDMRQGVQQAAEIASPADPEGEAQAAARAAAARAAADIKRAKDGRLSGTGPTQAVMPGGTPAGSIDTNSGMAGPTGNTTPMGEDQPHPDGQD